MMRYECEIRPRSLDDRLRVDTDCKVYIDDEEVCTITSFREESIDGKFSRAYVEIKCEGIEEKEVEGLFEKLRKLLG